MDPGAVWLARVRHDLVKRVLWAARDRRDLGGAPRPGELVVELQDDEGRAISAAALWAALRAEAPAIAGTEAALDTFGRAVAAAVAAAAADDLAGVLAIEPAFAEVARIMKTGEGSPR